jgi:non-specific serine/threonine protein kinase
MSRTPEYERLSHLAYMNLAGVRDEVQLQQGDFLYKNGYVDLDQTTATEALLTVLDYETAAEYTVTAHVARNAVRMGCNCPLSEANPQLLCAHKYGGYLLLRKKLGHGSYEESWQHTLTSAADAPVHKKTERKQILVFSVRESFGNIEVVPLALQVNLLGGADPLDAQAVMDVVVEKSLSESAKTISQGLVPERYVNIDPAMEIIVRGLLQTEAVNRYTYNRRPSGYGTLFQEIVRFPLFIGSVGDPLSRPVKYDQSPGRAEVQIEEAPDLELHFGNGEVKRRKQGLRVQPVVIKGDRTILLDETTTLSEGNTPWLLTELGDFFPVTDVTPAFRVLAERKDVIVPDKDKEVFFESFLPHLAQKTTLRSEIITLSQIDADPTPRLMLKEVKDVLVVELHFVYGGFLVPYDKNAGPVIMGRGADGVSLFRIHRRLEMESEFASGLSKFGLKKGGEPQEFALRANTFAVDFLIHHVPRLIENGYSVFGDQDLKSVKVNRNKPRLDFSVSSGIDWLDLNATISFGDATVSLANLRSAIRRKDQYVKLDDGTIGAIPIEWIKRYSPIFEFGKEEGENLRLSNHHFALVEDILTDADEVHVDMEFERRRDRLRSFDQIVPRTLPEGFTGELRSYQKSGFDWLHFLHDYEFGGILADDMGIGKTVQALTFLLSLKESGHNKNANLIVMPKSLLFNWEREASRFTPALKVLIHSENHRAKAGEFDGYDLVLTTYGVMMRDIDILRKYKFHYTVLDESQAIKNPLSLTGRAARKINTEHRLALTGTPVENGTMELWSQFAFANPGLLGDMDFFKNEFASAIEKARDESTAQLLRRMVFPFILRRTKEQVATDLPERSERIVYTEMAADQRALYEQTKENYRNQLLDVITKDGLGNVRMKILEALLRLRQIANHPRLVDPMNASGSGKFEAILETLETLRSEGHKALVFSQFVGMLTILRQALDSEDIPYAYLDGKTNNRQEIVDRYQNTPELPFFLISLKAGGVGLNLTAADYVVHIDPWWNPAVERQATDRTHRIGQDKPVFVYKFIAKDTVEEKILELQDRKRNLVDQLITTEEGFFKSLTADDISVLLE